MPGPVLGPEIRQGPREKGFCYLAAHVLLGERLTSKTINQEIDIVCYIQISALEKNTK